MSFKYFIQLENYSNGVSRGELGASPLDTCFIFELEYLTPDKARPGGRGI